MIFNKIKLLFVRYFRRGNVLKISPESRFDYLSKKQLKRTTVSVYGTSVLIVGRGASLVGVRIHIESGSSISIGENVKMRNAYLCAKNNSQLIIGSESEFDGVVVSVEKGIADFSKANVVSRGERVDIPNIVISDGTLNVGEHNVIKSSFWVRFGGEVKIGKYNCINEGSEIRCDEEVVIGSYNMISYNCDIWDTNTHSWYDYETKKNMFENDFPIIGLEKNKPNTKPIHIGNGNWVGKYACLLKGTTLGNCATVGTRTVVANQNVESGATIVSSKSVVIN